MNCPIHPIDARYQDYLTDESRITGQAQSISFPENEADVCWMVRFLGDQNIPMTIQGSRTGITGGAVPVRGHILNMSGMTQITGLSQDQDEKFLVRVQPGVLLETLNHQLSERRFNTRAWDGESQTALEKYKTAPRQFWPPDPSEKTASVGGIAATNARGICARHYGPARHHINGIRVVNIKGDVHCVMRRQYCFSNHVCPLPGGDVLRIAPGTSGKTDGLDLLDFFLGSEGMLGVITELELILAPMPPEIWGVVFFFTEETRAIAFVESLVSAPPSASGTHLVSVEFMDQTTLDIIGQLRRTSSRMAVLPAVDPEFTSAVCIEIHSNCMEHMERFAETLMAMDAAAGGDPDRSWAFCNETDMERFARFRHAAPEAANAIIDRARQADPRITKVSGDMQLKSGPVSALLKMYQQDLKITGLTAAIFGHAADGLFHVNILPKDYQEQLRAKALMESWAATVTVRGGSAVTEHGIGKVKSHLFSSIPLPRHMELVLQLKEKLDPDGIWNPGNIKINTPNE